LNADENQRETETPTRSVAAGRELLRRLQAAEAAGSSFALETTLSSRMYVAHVRNWPAAGFLTILHFIEVPSAEFAVQRVRERVRLGGHPIPESAIGRRYERGKTLFAQAYRPLFDLCYHWKTDDQGLQLVSRSATGN